MTMKKEFYKENNRQVYFEELIEICKKLIEDKETNEVTYIDDLYTMRTVLDDIICDYETDIDLDFNIIFKEEK